MTRPLLLCLTLAASGCGLINAFSGDRGPVGEGEGEGEGEICFDEVIEVFDLSLGTNQPHTSFIDSTSCIHERVDDGCSDLGTLARYEAIDVFNVDTRAINVEIVANYAGLDGALAVYDASLFTPDSTDGCLDANDDFGSVSSSRLNFSIPIDTGVTVVISGLNEVDEGTANLVITAF